MTQLLMTFGQFIDHDITLALPSSSKAAYTTGNVDIISPNPGIYIMQQPWRGKIKNYENNKKKKIE